ncbi:MAG TPA: glycosyltransferase family 39 protein [Bacteroidia bacterium]|nr:glycosyltransferase family 39 protein [Bacteroidia bacterium]
MENSGKWTEHPYRKNVIWILWLILATAAAIRLYAGYHLSLSNDELSALTRAKAGSLHELILTGVYSDYHPAGVEVFIYFWLKIFGEDSFIFRLPFIATGIGSVYLIYLLGKKWFSSFTGLLAASIFAVMKFTILYSMFARLYSPGLFFSLLTVLVWTGIIFPPEGRGAEKVGIRKWVWLVLTMSACTYIHYFSFVFVAGVGLSGLFFLRRNNFVQYLVSGGIVLALFIPGLPVFLEQMKTGDIGGWLAPPKNTFFLEFIFQLFNRSFVLNAIQIILSVSGLLVLLRHKSWNKFHSLSAVWVLFSFLVAFGYSVLRAPVLQYSTLFFCMPFLLFLLSSCVERIIPVRFSFSFIVLVLLGGTWNTISEGKLFSKSPFGLFKDPVMALNEWIVKYGPEQVPCVVNAINPEYMQYYFRELKLEPQVIAYRANTPVKFAALSGQLDTTTSPYMAFIWSNCENIYEVNKLILEKYPVLIEKRIFFNSAAYLYGKTGAGLPSPEIYKSCCDFDSLVWDEARSTITDQFAFNSNFAAKIDSSLEFSLHFQQEGKNVPGSGYRWISCRFSCFSEHPGLNALLVMQIDRELKTLYYYTRRLDEFTVRKEHWNSVVMSCPLPDDFKPEDVVKVYLWNKEKEAFFVDNYCVSFDQGDDPYQE